jgi:hypothetical protein
MNWPRWNPDLAGNALTLLLVAILLVVVGAVFIFLPSPLRNFNAGFGPEWNAPRRPKASPTASKRSADETEFW